jgi:hypothetical protein
MTEAPWPHARNAAPGQCLLKTSSPPRSPRHYFDFFGMGLFSSRPFQLKGRHDP